MSAVSHLGIAPLPGNLITDCRATIWMPCSWLSAVLLRYDTTTSASTSQSARAPGKADGARGDAHGKLHDLHHTPAPKFTDASAKLTPTPRASMSHYEDLHHQPCG